MNNELWLDININININILIFLYIFTKYVFELHMGIYNVIAINRTKSNRFYDA